jgi:hypothetical protein
MHFLHDVHEMNTYRRGHVCLSVCLPACLSVHMIQLKNRRTGLDEIWYGYYAIG